MSGISLICFTASYGVALLLELSRFIFRSRIRGTVMVLFAVAGLFAHTLFLWHRAQHSGLPLASAFDWYLVAAWAMAAIYLYLCVHHERSNTGVFVLPVALSLIAAARLANPAPFSPPRAFSAWTYVHSGLMLLAMVTVLCGFLAGLMYLLQSWRLKTGISPDQGLRLPSLEWLGRANARSLHLNSWFVAGGFLSGLVLNAQAARTQGTSLAWSDPVMLGLAAMLLWSVACSLFVTWYQPARRGRKVAYLTVAGMVFLALALGTLWLSRTQHPRLGGTAGGARNPERAPTDDTSAPSGTRPATAPLGGQP